MSFDAEKPNDQDATIERLGRENERLRRALFTIVGMVMDTRSDYKVRSTMHHIAESALRKAGQID